MTIHVVIFKADETADSKRCVLYRCFLWLPTSKSAGFLKLRFDTNYFVHVNIDGRSHHLTSIMNQYTYSSINLFSNTSCIDNRYCCFLRTYMDLFCSKESFNLYTVNGYPLAISKLNLLDWIECTASDNYEVMLWTSFNKSDKLNLYNIYLETGPWNYLWNVKCYNWGST